MMSVLWFVCAPTCQHRSCHGQLALGAHANRSNIGECRHQSHCGHQCGNSRLPVQDMHGAAEHISVDAFFGVCQVSCRMRGATWSIMCAGVRQKRQERADRPARDQHVQHVPRPGECCRVHNIQHTPSNKQHATLRCRPHRCWCCATRRCKRSRAAGRRITSTGAGAAADLNGTLMCTQCCAHSPIDRRTA